MEKARASRLVMLTERKQLAKPLNISNVQARKE